MSGQCLSLVFLMSLKKCLLTEVIIQLYDKWNHSSLLLYLVVELLCEPRISFICGRRRIAIICNYIPWEYVFTFWSYNGKDLKIFRGMDDLQKYVSLIYSLSLLTIANLYTLQAGFEPWWNIIPEPAKQSQWE